MNDGSIAAQLYQIAGFAGDFAILLAYFLQQTRRLPATGVMFPLLNLAGAVGILVSLVGAFNLPVALLESAWVVVSGYGIVRAVRDHRATR